MRLAGKADRRRDLFVETVPGPDTLAAAAPATLSAELAALVFTPQPGLAPTLTAVKDSLLVTVTDSASELSNSPSSPG